MIWVISEKIAFKMESLYFGKIQNGISWGKNIILFCKKHWFTPNKFFGIYNLFFFTPVPTHSHLKIC